jgi:Tol biopolymer transport system component
VAGAYYLGRRGAAELKGEFERVTFQRGYVTSARFSPDGQTIIYSATWNEDPVRVFSTRRGSPEFRVLDLPPSHILSISSRGEMALLDAHPGKYHPMERAGTLSVAPLAGGSPRPRIEDVQSADWSPGGDELAVVIARAAHRLEYPAGKLLLETNGKVASPRISPDGKLVAFLEQPQAGDDAGRVAVVDREGKVKRLTGMWRSCHGLAWSQNGNDILFTAAGEMGGRQLRAVSTGGRARLISYEADRLTLHDLQKDDCLLTHETYRMGILANRPGGPGERDASWLDGSYLCDILPDGNTVVFSEGGASMRGLPSVYLRRMDGGLPVRLGEGVGGTISSDGRWVAAIEKPGSNVMTVIPTGAGETLRHELKLARLMYLRWRPGTPYILSTGLENKGASWSTFQVHSRTGELSRLGGEGMQLAGPLSLDGKTAVMRAKDNQPWLVSLDTGKTLRAVPLESENESVVCFARDGRSILVSEYSGMPLPIWRLDLSTGKRTLWKSLQPADRAGIARVANPFAVPELDRYLYNFESLTGELFLLKSY